MGTGAYWVTLSYQEMINMSQPTFKKLFMTKYLLLVKPLYREHHTNY